MSSVVIVDDDDTSREMLAAYVRDFMSIPVSEFSSGFDALEYLEQHSVPIVITDIRMPGMNGMQLLREIKSSKNIKNTKVILVTGFANLDTCIEAIRQGAYDYLVKPIEISYVADIINKILAENEQTKNVSPDKQEKNLSLHYSCYEHPIIGKIGVFSSQMQKIVETALKLSQDDLPVLIEGESGTGKEIIASLIHYGEKGNKKPFVTINCAAITPSLFESELFGYDEGAFTGGKSGGKRGKLDIAQGGTLLLDEIGEIPNELQAKLLRVLEEKAFYRVGGVEKIPLNVRIIASTNKNLKDMVDSNRFRIDLYYRLCAAHLVLPALRQQKEAIAPMAQMFLTNFAIERNKKFRLIDKHSAKILQEHPWYGNVRELKNAIERVVLLYDDYELRPHHISFLEEYSQLGDTDKFVLRPGSFVLPDEDINLEELNYEIVQKALAKFNGNKTQTARYLGLTPSALRSRLKK
jgi:DNA-binding NtrC family response regulator